MVDFLVLTLTLHWKRLGGGAGDGGVGRDVADDGGAGSDG